MQNLKGYFFANIFSLEWDHQEDVYPATALLILKAILEKSPLLERLVLIDGGSDNLPFLSAPHKFSDHILEFASKMTHMSCFCVTFNQLAVDLMKEIKERVENEVVAERPSLWFHLDRNIPEASDAGVPSVHYHQIVEPVSFVLPRL